jgi:hypothetical protein
MSASVEDVDYGRAVESWKDLTDFVETVSWHIGHEVALAACRGH